LLLPKSRKKVCAKGTANRQKRKEASAAIKKRKRHFKGRKGTNPIED